MSQGENAAAVLTIEKLSVSLVREGGVPTRILDDINLAVNAGEIVCLRGVNGSGKTTLLNIIAGLQRPTTGNVEFAIDNVSVGYVQQDYTSSLLPWYNALENIAIPLRLKGIDKKARQRLALAQLDDLGFHQLPVHAFPHQLSGGQKQRVAIARALLANPNLLLLDEPFANLDGRTVRELEEALLTAHSRRSLTIILVSHDIDSSVYISDRIVVLGGAPSSIQGVIPVSLQRPRQRNMIFSNSYEGARVAVQKREEALYEGG